MRYRSTRGKAKNFSLEEAVLEGLATDGGLFIPNSIPKLSLPEILSWANLPFPKLAFQIFRKFIATEEIPDADLQDILTRSFATFSSPEVTPLRKLPNVNSGSGDRNFDNLYVLELFHGPTFAFKDVALQVLGNLFEFFLERRNRKAAASGSGAAPYSITVLGATSGDTGGAAIYGLRGKKGIEVFILHPKNRISPVQEQQMTSVLDENVHNVAVEGTFDDCQDIVKTLFSDEPFRRRFHLAAINSINWARILAQTTYYFYSYFSLLRQIGVPLDTSSYAALTKIQYCVPTGNFGDILAGYYAVRMGLPIHRLVIATNENDILHRFFETGRYEKRKKNAASGGAQGAHSAATAAGPDAAGAPGAGGLAGADASSSDEEVRQTLSPAMDILISSNFERLAWYLVRGDGRIGAEVADDEAAASAASATISRLMNDLKANGGFSVEPEVLARAKELFTSRRVSDSETTDAIHRYYHNQFAFVPNAPETSSDPSVRHYILDPHTAVGVVTAESVIAAHNSAGGRSEAVFTICLSTASPGKFPEAVMDAINNEVPVASVQQGFTPVKYEDFAPKELVALTGLPKRCVDVGTEGGKKELGLVGVRAVIEKQVGAKYPEVAAKF
ncbi:threonine synthase [Borealophlyctis nickersoniae]|nr:threonine synthase [Borealophlyctis nickersoniae]